MCGKLTLSLWYWTRHTGFWKSGVVLTPLLHRCCQHPILYSLVVLVCTRTVLDMTYNVFSGTLNLTQSKYVLLGVCKMSGD